MRPLLTLALALLSLAFVGCDKKSEMAGRWVTKETIVKKATFGGDKTDNVVRTLVLNSNGSGEFQITENGQVTRHDVGQWSVVSDIFFLDHAGGQTFYLRIVRLTKERLVIRTEEGVERIYDRVQ
jgi:hypothetical protein